MYSICAQQRTVLEQSLVETSKIQIMEMAGFQFCQVGTLLSCEKTRWIKLPWDYMLLGRVRPPNIHSAEHRIKGEKRWVGWPENKFFFC